MECVRKATEKYYKENVNHEYLPISGSPQFCKLALELAYKSDFKYMDRLAAIQSISGSGALRIGQRFLYQFYPFKKKYITLTYMDKSSYNSKRNRHGNWRI